MKNHFASRVLGLFAASGLSWPALSPAQVNIVAADLFNQPGQYYRARANSANTTSVSVNGMLGSAGENRFWDFTAGPSEVVYRFDYLAASNAPHSTAFVAAGARMAEQKTDESGTAAQAWLYFTQHPTQGRMAYGFHDPGFSAGVGASDPQVLFSPVLIDFPATIHYGSTWSSTTTFTNFITFGDPEDPILTATIRYVYSSTAVVDAYGVANSPGSISFGDCLRVNELATYVISADFDGSGFDYLETDYVRNFYWLRPGRGIIAQVTSEQSSGTPPDNNFLTASSIVRMFETNHPDNTGSGTGGGIQGLRLTLGPNSGLLQWTPLASANSYRVEYSATPTGGWQQLGSTTTANFFIDPAAGRPAMPIRFYRVVGLP
jgi:hypothetical protein